MRVWKSTIAIALGATILIVAYQNCAQDPGANSGASSLQQPTDVEIDYPVYAMNQAGSESGDSAVATLGTSTQKALAENCRFENLSCLRKIYSPAVQDFSTEEAICLANSPDRCLTIQAIYYNTSHALENCPDCSAEDAKVGGQYNREEVTCWVGDRSLQPAAVFALRSRFEDAAKAALASCGGGF